MNETKDTIDNISQHTLKVMMSLDSPVIYSQSEDRGHLQGEIDKTKHLPIEVHQSEPLPLDVEPCNVVEDATDVTLDNSKKDDELNGTHKGVLGFDSSVNRTPEIGTCNSPELSQMTPNMAIEQQTGGLVSAEEHAAALGTIKHLKELNEKLSKDIQIAQESRVNNQPSVEAVAESGQTSLKEVVDDDVNDDAGDSNEESVVDIIPSIYSNERMNKNDQLKIQRNMRSLWLNIEPRELIIELHSLLVFDEDEFVFLLDYAEKKGRSLGALQMLMKLYRKGPNAYILFLVALERCNHTWVIKILEPDCVICEGRIKYSGQKYYELIDNTSPKYREFVTRCEKNIGDVYDDHPGQQFVVVKKLAKGCVEVTFHLISLGYNNEENLRRPLEDLVQSGFIDTDPVKPDEFYFRQITGEELASERELMTQGRIIVLEKEIETLKLQINELRLENAALRAISANSQEVETYKEHLAKKYTDTLQDKELIISSLQEQLGEQATASNVDIDRADGELLKKKENDVTSLADEVETYTKHLAKRYTDTLRDKERQKEKRWTLTSLDDGQDKDTVATGADASQSPARKSRQLFSACQFRARPDRSQSLFPVTSYSSPARRSPDRSQSLFPLTSFSSSEWRSQGATNKKIEQIIDYLVTRHPDKVRPLVELLKDKDVIDDDDSKQIIVYIDKDDIKMATQILTNRFISRPHSYQCFVECVKQLGLSYVLDKVDEGDDDIFETSVKSGLMRFEKHKKDLIQQETGNISQSPDWILVLDPPSSMIPIMVPGFTDEYQRKIISQTTGHLLTRYPDKVRPLVELLKDKDLIDDDDSKQIIMYIDKDDIKLATQILTSRLISRPNSYQCFVECVKELGLSDTLDMNDKGDVDILTPLGTKKSGLMRFEEQDLKKQETKNISTGFSVHTSHSRSSPE